MNRSQKQPARTLVIPQQVPIEVTPLPFRPLDSVSHLDLESLARARNARIELGSYDGGCCRRMLHAVVRQGKVTKFELDPCTEVQRVTPEMARVLADIHRAVASRGEPGPKFPFPVHELPEAVARIKYSVWVCVKICCFGYCLTCCVDKTWVSSVWAKCSVASKK